MTDKYTRFWSWSKSCVPLSSLLADIKIQQAVDVADSIITNVPPPHGPYSIQLNCTTRQGRIIQNVVALFRPDIYLWETAISDASGRIGANIGDVVRYNVPNGIVNLYEDGEIQLGFVNSPTDGVFATIALLSNSDQISRQATQALGLHDDDVQSLNVAIVGVDGGSYATFRGGQFGIDVFTDVFDMAVDGQNPPQGKPSPPEICGKTSYPQTNENGNLWYEVIEIWKNGGKLVVHL